MSLPVFDLTRAPPGQMTMPAVVGGAVEGGRSMSGVVAAADMTGGGLVTVKYSNVELNNATGDALRYWSLLAAILNSGVRSILVPLLVDYIQPVINLNSTPLRTKFSDGKQFTDGTRFTQPALGTSALIANDAPANAGTVTLNIGARDLVGGEWFEVVHPTKLNRVYCVTDIDSDVQNGNGTRTVVVGIRPPLREAAAAGTSISFDRPKFPARLEPGTKVTADVKNFWWATPEVSFIESFGPF